MLGERFGDAVGEGLDQDRRVVVAGGLVPLRDRELLWSGGHDEGADVIRDTGVAGRDEVADREVRFAVASLQLLSQPVQSSCLPAAGRCRRRRGVPARTRRRPSVRTTGSATTCSSSRCPSSNSGSRRVTELGVGEDRRVAAAQAPGVEERGPVDVGHEVGDVDVVERAHSGVRGRDDRRCVEREPAGVGACILDRDPAAFDLGALVRLDHPLVFDVEVGEERRRVGRRRAASRSRPPLCWRRRRAPPVRSSMRA